MFFEKEETVNQEDVHLGDEGAQRDITMLLNTQQLSV